MPFKSVFVAAILSCTSAASLAGTPLANPASIPLATFFADSQFGGAALSPDGLNVALLPRGPDGKLVLAVKSTAGGPARILASIKDSDVGDVHWINNQRLAYSARHKEVDDSDRPFGPGLHAINIDGSKDTYLVRHTWAADVKGDALPPNTHFLSSVHEANSNDIYVTRYNAFTFEGYTVLRLDTVTANLKAVDVPREINGVIVDANGVPRVATLTKFGRVHMLFKDAKTGAWREVADEPWDSRELKTPALVTPSGELYVVSNHGRDTSGLYHFDTATGKLDAEPVIQLKNYDFDGNLILAADHETVLGVRYETSEWITTWFDEGMRQLQAKVDKALPSTINQIVLPSEARDSDIVLVHSYSDLEPGFSQLYQRSTGAFTRLGTRMPEINPLQMAEMKMVHYKARDGRDIPAYLTLPKGASAKSPMVVLVHGAAWSRGGHLRWDDTVQFLASRGYAVLQPEFRGSTGFGYSHFTAGWKQWGQAMQDDIADGAKWAVAQGHADGARICIAGGNYGGYATLMGLARDPDLFHCGVDWIGITDLNLIYDQRYTSTPDDVKQFGLPLLLGDQSKDAAMLKAASPITHAARISKPLLLVYGGKDRDEPIEQARKFYEAVKKTNPKVELVEYDKEGHGWYYENTKLDFWNRVERFLDQNIGKH